MSGEVTYPHRTALTVQDAEIGERGHHLKLTRMEQGDVPLAGRLPIPPGSGR